MNRYRMPRAPLAPFVEMLWLHEGYVRPHPRERLLPNATMELVIGLKDGARADDTRGTTLVGAHSQSWVLDTSEAISVIGVHFKAGGGFPFFAMPAGELHNLRVPLDVVWGEGAASVVDQVRSAPTVDAKFDALESALLDRARSFVRHPAVAFAVRELSRATAARSVGDVTDAIGMSQRRFLDRFRGEVGMAPKLFARVRRFQAVIATVHTLREVDWADVAATCGYFDQAHFIHDFRAFSGFTPAEYFALKSEHRNHVPLPG